MSESSDRAELWRRLKELETIGDMAFEGAPLSGGFLPEVDSEWNLVVALNEESGKDVYWYVTDLGVRMLNETDVDLFDEGIEEIQRMVSHTKRSAKQSKVRATLAMTLFLPIMAIVAILRFPSHPGSRHSLGELLLGFGSILAIIGFVVGLLTTNWLLVGVCVYWFAGAKVIEVEATYRGLI